MNIAPVGIQTSRTLSFKSAPAQSAAPQTPPNAQSTTGEEKSPSTLKLYLLMVPTLLATIAGVIGSSKLVNKKFPNAFDGVKGIFLHMATVLVGGTATGAACNYAMMKADEHFSK